MSVQIDIKGIKKYRVVICCCIVFLLLVGGTYLYAVTTYPQIEFELSSTNAGEPVLLYYTDKTMEKFDDEHMIWGETTGLTAQKYIFCPPDIDSLRIDLGTNVGTTWISDVTVKTFFTIKKVPIQYIAKCGFSSDISTVSMEGSALRIESIGTDPYVVLGTLEDVDSVFSWKRMVILVLAFVLIMSATALAVEYYQKIGDDFSLFSNEGTKIQWVAMSVMLILIAVVRYFYKLDAWPSFYNDEYQSFGVAYGYLKTGTFYQWDFTKDCISNSYYNRAWPFTILLANWIRIFGLSEVSCRAMSALLGVIFVASCIYITRQWFQNITITFLTVIIILSNSTIAQLFRYTRMYALLMPLSLWMVYCAFNALTLTNHIKDSTRNKVLIFIKRNFDFHIGYVIGTLLLFYFGWRTHVNSVVLCFGILLFIFYKVFSTKERKYIIVTIAASAIMFLICFGIFFYEKIKRIPILGEIIGALRTAGGWFAEIHIEYLQTILEEFGSELLAILCIVIYILAIIKLLCKRLNEEMLDKMLYLGAIMFTTILFFVFFTNRYYASKYIIMLTPISAMVYAIGYSLIYQGKKIIGSLLGICLIVAICLNIGRGYEALYTSVDSCNFLPAYKTISKYYDLEKDTVPIAGVYVRGYYFSQLIKNYASADLRADDGDDSMDTLMEFSEKYPEGIMACESSKLWHLTQDVEQFMIRWSDHLSGEGIDNYNVEVSHYYFIDGQILDKPKDNIDKYDIYFDINKQEIRIYVDLEEFEDYTKILCVRINIEKSNGKEDTRVFQLRLPEIKTGYYQYILPSNCLKEYNIEKIEIENNYAIYGNGVLEDYSR